MYDTSRTIKIMALVIGAAEKSEMMDAQVWCCFQLPYGNRWNVHQAVTRMYTMQLPGCAQPLTTIVELFIY